MHIYKHIYSGLLKIQYNPYIITFLDDLLSPSIVYMLKITICIVVTMPYNVPYRTICNVPCCFISVSDFQVHASQVISEIFVSN